MRAQRDERPWWAFALVGLLVLNLLVFGVVLLRGGTRSEEAPPATTRTALPSPSPAPSAPARLARPTVGFQDPAVRSLAEEAGVAEAMDDSLDDAASEPIVAGAPRRAPPVQPIQGPATAPVRAAPPPAATRDEVLPTLSELTASGSAQLPPMHLDIHVYSTTPAERFVFINMRKYREGEAMSEGPTVERIERDGVVMNHRGLRFLMPRQ